MSAADVSGAGIRELQRSMEDGDLTAVALVDLYLARIRAYDQSGPALNAVVRINPNARAEAERLDVERRQRGPRGPLHGIPILLKDNYVVDGLPTSAGSVVLEGVHTFREGEQVRRLREAGAILLAKGNLFELAADNLTVSALGGTTLNPYDPSRSPGGSSGGTAVAVAAGFATFGMGTDTCGSLSGPASYTSLVTLRPTKGLSGTSGIVPVSHSADVAAPMARTMEDLAIALDATVGYDPDDPSTSLVRDQNVGGFEAALATGDLQHLRLGVLRQLFNEGSGADPQVVAVIDAAIASLESLGATVRDVQLPALERLIEASHLTPFEFRHDLKQFLATHTDADENLLAETLARGSYHELAADAWELLNTDSSASAHRYAAALRERERFRKTVVSLMDRLQLDAILYPAMNEKPARTGDPQAGNNCALSARTGLPALTIPAGVTEDQLPVGLEMLGRPFSDRELVSWGYAFERATRHRRWPLVTPPLVDGARAPSPIALSARALMGAGSVTGRFTLDPVRNLLTYAIDFQQVDSSRVYAITLHAKRPGRASPIIARLAGPERDDGEIRGSLLLAPRDRAALDAGGVTFGVFSEAQPLGTFSDPLTEQPAQ